LELRLVLEEFFCLTTDALLARTTYRVLRLLGFIEEKAVSLERPTIFLVCGDFLDPGSGVGHLFDREFFSNLRHIIFEPPTGAELLPVRPSTEILLGEVVLGLVSHLKIETTDRGIGFTLIRVVFRFERIEALLAVEVCSDFKEEGFEEPSSRSVFKLIRN